MMKFGFEKEYFLMRGKDFVLCPLGIPADACGFLAEARGEPHENPLKAAFLLLAEEERIKNMLPKKLKLCNLALKELSPELLREAVRLHGKSAMPSERGNLYGKDYAADDKLARAGLHVHFSNLRELKDEEGRMHSIAQMLDIPKIVRQLDEAFKEEIDVAQRIPGCYELKVHGFEYRSLPATVDVRKVARKLATMRY